MLAQSRDKQVRKPQSGGKKVENTLLTRHGLTARAEADDRRRVYLTPTSVIWTSERGVHNSAALLENRPIQVGLHNDNCCELDSSRGMASILLDYGQELTGGLLLSIGRLSGADEVCFRVRFGESATEAMSESGVPGGSTNDHAWRDWTVNSSFLSTLTIGDTGFRFIRLDLLTQNAKVQLCAAKAMFIYRELPYLGSFSCSDELLNRIWQTGAYTVHLNMQRYIWDGVKRDRLVWVGDLHPEVSTIQTVFGDQPIIHDSLDFVTAQTPASQWMNDFPSYSMWWIIIQHDYFMQFGNRDYLARQLPYLKELFANLSAQIGPDGADHSPERFFDWPTRGHDRAVDAGIQALHILAARASAHIFREFGEEALAEQAEWDCVRLGQIRIDPDGFKQTAAMAVLAGLLDAKQTAPALRQGGAEGMTSFMGYYVLLAQAVCGDYSGALDMIRDFWGGMLKLGATTFWEDFDIRWLGNAAPIDRLPNPGEIDVHASYGDHCYRGFRHSLCHGWASGPTAWLSCYVLGVEILAPGCKKVRITPHLGDLAWAKGSYPTPFGIIRLEHHKRADGTIETTVDAPPEIEIVS